MASRSVYLPVRLLQLMDARATQAGLSWNHYLAQLLEEVATPKRRSRR